MLFPILYCDFLAAEIDHDFLAFPPFELTDIFNGQSQPDAFAAELGQLSYFFFVCFLGGHIFVA